jgi:hypothetical protein
MQIWFERMTGSARAKYLCAALRIAVCPRQAGRGETQDRDTGEEAMLQFH